MKYINLRKQLEENPMLDWEEEANEETVDFFRTEMLIEEFDEEEEENE